MDRRKSRLTSQVFEQLREGIVRGELPPNTPLSEQELCERLEVSRTPIREALIKLAEEELVMIYPQFGTFVAPISLEAVRVGQFVREHLECALIADAARRIDEAGKARIRANVERQERATDMEEFYALDNEFHSMIAELSGHPGVWSVILKAKTQFDRVRFLSVRQPGRPAEILYEHRRIADELCAGDGDAAQIALRIHLRGVFATVERLSLTEALPSAPPKRRRRTAPAAAPAAASE
ncbi:GntR family transcriptional regulator [Siculibacillus lacustris]|uniref:GntR family transcriptional regulator n=1 Tax=Siculibacillus lacustris TaxID=1549641 RepID=A0A4Q9VUS4_9HYPH|nr:GntR family transcriptional regulator [Siculibacillus lacustris]TBW39826.1 GntR family transcriptional regulator [Siculibacillus lacustris]